MDQFRKVVMFGIIWFVINIVAKVTFFDKGYYVSWGIFGFLLVILAMFVAVCGLTVVIIFMKWLLGLNTYRITKWLALRSVWIIVLPIFMLLQVIASELFVHSPSNGEIASIEEVDLSGSTQFYTVRTKDESNPVILFLAGGPGGTQIPTTRRFLVDLEENYTIVNWEQPGVGKSYDAHFPNDDLSPETYITDAHLFTQFLKEKYNQDKIYIIGESWGSYVGIMLANLYPDDYYAYIGTGQMVDFTETEIYCYNLSMELAIERNDQEFIDKLNEMGTPPIIGKNISVAVGTYLQSLYMYMERHEDIYHNDWDTFDIIFSPEYSIYDVFNYARGLYYTFSKVYQQLYGVNLREETTEFQIPIYLIHGTYDVNAPGYLVDDYYALINAPEKELIWFEHSGHNPWINESDLFVEEVRRLFVHHEE